MTDARSSIILMISQNGIVLNVAALLLLDTCTLPISFFVISRSGRQDDSKGKAHRTGLHDEEGLGEESRPGLREGAHALLKNKRVSHFIHQCSDCIAHAIHSRVPCSRAWGDCGGCLIIKDESRAASGFRVPS